MCQHGVEEIEPVSQVVVEIPLRVCVRPAHQRFGGEVEHGVNVCGVENVVEEFAVSQVSLNKNRRRMNCSSMTLLQVV